jgi:hypothetical protein
VVGTPYQVALRLYHIAADHWPVIDAAYPSVDLIRLRAYRFLNFIYAWCLDHVEPDKREEWIYMLNQPLPGRETKPTESELEADAESFMAAMAQLKGA